MFIDTSERVTRRRLQERGRDLAAADVGEQPEVEEVEAGRLRQPARV
jgi:hypothetical protein